MDLHRTTEFHNEPRERVYPNKLHRLVDDTAIEDHAVQNHHLAEATEGTLKGRFTERGDQPLLTVRNALDMARVDVPSAGTCYIGAALSPYVRVTGTATITAFDAVPAGRMRTVLFASALLLTHNGTSLILPGAANITTAAGDVAEFVNEGSNWRCLRYRRASQGPTPPPLTRYLKIVFTDINIQDNGPIPISGVALQIALDGGSFQAAAVGTEYKATSRCQIRHTNPGFALSLGGGAMSSGHYGTVTAIGAGPVISTASLTRATCTWTNSGGGGGSTTISGFRSELANFVPTPSNATTPINQVNHATGATLTVAALNLGVSCSDGNPTSVTAVLMEYDIFFTI